MGPKTFLFAAVLATVAVTGGGGCKKDENVVQVTDKDVEMNRAIAEARQRWPELVTAFASQKEGDIFSAKYPFPVVGGGHEHIWLTVTEVTADRVTGTIDNEPVKRIDHEVGDRVTVPSAEISDWLYTRAGSKDMTGGFTIEVMMARKQGR